MIVTTDITNLEKQFIEAPEKPPKASLLKTMLWLAVILFLPQLILFFVFGVFWGAQDNDLTQSTSVAWHSSVAVMLGMTLMAPLITLPLLNRATKVNTWRERFNFWALKAISVKLLCIWLGVGITFWLFSSLVGEWLKLPIEPFMLEVKAATDSMPMIALIIITICIVAPIVEEVIFRGWLYSKLVQTKLSNAGAMGLSAILFTLIHTQYDNFSTFLMILLLGLLLSLVRFISGNINYSIAIHMLYNSLSTMALFFFI